MAKVGNVVGRAFHAALIGLRAKGARVHVILILPALGAVLRRDEVLAPRRFPQHP